MSDFTINIEHDYNVVLIYLTDNIHFGSVELINNLKERQPIDKNVLTEVRLLHFKDKEIMGEDQAKLIDLIRIYCDDFDASSVYIFGENSHYDNIKILFNANPKYIKSDCLVKFIKSNPKEDIDDVAIVLHEKIK